MALLMQIQLLRRRQCHNGPVIAFRLQSIAAYHRKHSEHSNAPVFARSQYCTIWFVSGSLAWQFTW